MSDWTLTFPPEIIYYIVVPLLIPLITIMIAWRKRGEVTAVRQYIIEELKEDMKDIKERIRILELLSPGSLGPPHHT